MQIYDVFISYRRSDGAAIAKKLNDDLTAKGLRVFYDVCTMEDGHYFTTQIEQNLRKAPNYVLVASSDVFKFREGEDWVRTEIAIALKTYESNSNERTITVLTPPDAFFPEKRDLPPDVCSIADVQRIAMHDDWSKKVLQAVTKVNRCNLWHSAHRWLENSKEYRGRFARLNVAEGILPQAIQKPTSEALPVFIRNGRKNGRECPLFEALSADNNHGYLIGEGGIGKTTALMHIMNQAYHNKAYDPHAQIPLFVELSYAPDTFGRLYEDGKSSFIRRSIYKQLRDDRSFKQISARAISEIDEVFRLPASVAVHPINTVFSKNTTAPEYLLLLDGLNEVSTVELQETQCSIMDMIVREICLLMEAFPNVRVLLTSRSDYLSIQDQNLSRYYLTGLREEAVSSYLTQQGVCQTNIDGALLNKQLAETLKVPLFLTMYAGLSDKAKAYTQGEILKLFFCERRENGQLYTARNRLDKIEHDVSTASSAVQTHRITVQMQDFILDFILPELAWYMEKEGLFYLPVRNIKKIIMPVLLEPGELSVCGDFGQEVFCQYRKGSVRRSTKTVAKKILEQFGDDAAVEILDCCVLALGILQECNGRYGFIHQHIRDYFAAVKYINTLRLAVYMYESKEPELARSCMDAVFSTKPVGMTVRRFIGESLGEHHNQPQSFGSSFVYGVPLNPQDRNLIDRALNIYRGRFRPTSAAIWSALEQAAQGGDNGMIEHIIETAKLSAAQSGGYGLYSLTKILAEVRQILAGVDLSDLDLSKCQLNGTGLSVKGLSATLHGAKLTADNLFLPGHTGRITSVVFSPDGKTILSASDDGTAKLWDAVSAELLHTFDCEEYVFLAGFINNGQQILTVSKHAGLLVHASEVSMRLWDARFFRLITDKVLAAVATSAVLSPDGAHLLLRSSNHCCVISTSSLEIVCSRSVDFKTVFNIAYSGFLGNEKWMLTYSNGTIGCSIEIIDILSNQTVYTGNHAQPIQCVRCHPNVPEAAILTIAGMRKHCLIVNSEDGSAIAELDITDTKRKFVKDIQYSGNGKWISVATLDQLLLYSAEDHTPAYVFSNGGGPSAFNDACSKILLSGSNAIHLYGLDQFECLLSISSTPPLRPCAAISPSGKWIATCSGDGKLRLWDSDSMKLAGETDVYGTRIWFSTDGNRIYVVSNDSDFLISVPDLQIIANYSESRQISPDGKYYAIWNDDKASVYDMAQHQLILITDPAEEAIFCGDRVMVREETNFLTVYDLPGGTLCRAFPDCLDADISADHAAAFSAEGQLLIWPLNLPLDICWTVDKQETSRILKFSPNGKYLVEAGKDHIIVRETEGFGILHQRQLQDLEIVGVNDQTVVVTHRTSDSPGTLTVTVFRLETMEECFSVTIQTGNNMLRHSPVLAHSDTDLLLQMRGDTLHHFRFGPIGLEAAKTIALAPGLDVKGLELQHLHKGSTITDGQKQILRQYGAKI